jgi:hypothetical protein
MISARVILSLRLEELRLSPYFSFFFDLLSRNGEL